MCMPSKVHPFRAGACQSTCGTKVDGDTELAAEKLLPPT